MARCVERGFPQLSGILAPCQVGGVKGWRVHSNGGLLLVSVRDWTLPRLGDGCGIWHGAIE